MLSFKSIKTNFPPIVFAVVFLALCSIISVNAQNLKTREIDLKGCLRTAFGADLIIKDRVTFLKKIGNDASRAFCLKNLEKIDFDKNTLVGIDLSTGYCGMPLGLTVQAVKDEAEKQFVIKIGYIEPNGTCRALSSYDLWLLVPKLPENYTVKFDVRGNP